MDRRLRKTWGWIIWKERNSRYFAQEILFILVPIFEFAPLPFFFSFFLLAKRSLSGFIVPFMEFLEEFFTGSCL